MEELPNFDVLTSSQNSNLDEEQLNKIEQKLKQKTLRELLNWDCNSLTNGARSEHQDRFKSISSKELKEILRKRTATNSKTSALTGVRAAIHRHITSVPLSRNVNILQDNDFNALTSTLHLHRSLFYIM